MDTDRQRERESQMKNNCYNAINLITADGALNVPKAREEFPSASTVQG